MSISIKSLMVIAIPAMLVCSWANALEIGPIADWESGEADIFIFDGEMPDVIGNIDAQGRVEIELPEGIESERKFAESFSCPYDGEISISAPDATFASGPSLEVARVAEQQYIGELVPFSSADYARQWRAAMSAGDNAPAGGSSFNLIYVSEPVRVEGTCDYDMQIDGAGTAPVKMHTEYAMDFDAGWQFLESRTRDSVTSSIGVTWATDSLMGSTSHDSDRIQWVVFMEK